MVNDSWVEHQTIGDQIQGFPKMGGPTQTFPFLDPVEELGFYPHAAHRFQQVTIPDLVDHTPSRPIVTVLPAEAFFVQTKISLPSWGSARSVCEPR